MQLRLDWMFAEVFEWVVEVESALAELNALFLQLLDDFVSGDRAKHLVVFASLDSQRDRDTRDFFTQSFGAVELFGFA